MKCTICMADGAHRFFVKGGGAVCDACKPKVTPGGKKQSPKDVRATAPMAVRHV